MMRQKPHSKEASDERHSYKSRKLGNPSEVKETEKGREGLLEKP
jgi:hypothetical protein